MKCEHCWDWGISYEQTVDEHHEVVDTEVPCHECGKDGYAREAANLVVAE